MNRVHNFRNIILIIIAMSLILGLTAFLSRKKAVNIETKTTFSAWITDWDYKEGMSDFRKLAEGLTQVQVFAAYFNSSDNLIFTEDFRHLRSSMSDDKTVGGPKVFLTVVNDRINDSGSTVQKDPEILSRLMETKETRSRHIDELVKKTEEGGFDGIEIDYEKIPQESLRGYSDFLKELYSRASNQKLLVRVVLEANNKLDKSTLPEGPQYVVMLYNLYGTHSGPGPKADYEFIRKTLKKFSEVPGKNNVAALACGGFDWYANGKAVSLTEQQAVKLAKDHNADLNREKNSGALNFTYLDEKNMKHTVWYADKETISGWVKESEKQGCNNIALWRLGGCSQDLIDFFIGE